MSKLIFLIVVSLSLNVATAFAQNEDWLDLLIDGNVEKVQSFIDTGTDVDATDKDGDTLLIQASILGYNEIVELLIVSGADVNFATSGDELLAGYTALIWATAGDNTETVELLIANGADVNATSEAGVTALIQASYGGSAEIVELLIANGAKVNVTDNDGNTSLDLAKENLEYHTKELTEDPDSAEYHIEQIRNSGKIIALLNAHGAECNLTC